MFCGQNVRLIFTQVNFIYGLILRRKYTERVIIIEKKSRRKEYKDKFWMFLVKNSFWCIIKVLNGMGSVNV